MRRSRRETTLINKSDLQLHINSEIRKAELRRLETMSWELAIPPADYKLLIELDPELVSDDKLVRLIAWKEFIASDLSIPYRVRDARSKMRMTSGKTTARE